ncbi:MAG: phenylalanine--tRNA ligase subunit beta [Ignavibacteria bacterium]|nr:phenylalanine--tRNA ligase subunit beta [Ignavibacteria bacterium]MCU7500810.1 phenylalanine--tRNA ligase subunit beta [Ignavibacteria bacterium]MCU7513887.1 phenylalanine--tRNA ligase subunit beta [Ignavibacteria bacterium]MCU7521676.1 phenylalanine--tRNA ligase subunit beta [Ignavibacteria bacterium]MCU7525599.1 phenylalanine--tRNA ligase subunit beta [Ignavibacteria bacterium]
MKISLNWLKDYVDLEGIASSEIIDKLTISGLEVEDVEEKGAEFDNIVVGFVKEKKKHPNADKLSVCAVSTGAEEFNVVCGAPNVQAGQKVAFAKIGAVIPEGGFKITKAKLRGEVSMGMICSEKELGLSDDHSGIMVLDNGFEPGTPLKEALGLDDTVIEVAITPNRPDALSHIGVARDLAAIFNRKVKLPEVNVAEAGERIEKLASVEIQDNAGCPRYTARVIRNVNVKESPNWLKKKLTSVGLRPINNIVDVTNFILHELGQPLHAFDLDRLEGQKIVVRRASDGETFTTLDSKERKLTSNDLMICDAEKPVAIAGVMGGENSEVTNATKNILLESAYFNPSSIRKTSKSLILSTDASYRYERGTDPNITPYAANRAMQLMAELAGGEVQTGTIDVYPEKIEPMHVTLRFNQIERILGFGVEKGEVKDILLNLGLKSVMEGESELTFEVPTFRPDIEREIDLIEEIARIYGYDRIPTVEKISITLSGKTDQSAFKDTLRDAANGLGFYEIISNSLQSKEVASLTGSPVEMLNPLSVDMAALRTSLLPGALYAVAKNLNVGEKNLKLFEIGHVFNKLSEGEIKSFKDFSETPDMMFTVTGKADTVSWYSKERAYDIYDLKGIVNSFLEKICLDNVLVDSYNLVENKNFEYIFEKKYKDQVVGRGGLVRKDVLKKFDISQEVYCFEFNLSALAEIPVPQKRFKGLLKFPKVLRDCAFILDKNVTSQDVVGLIYKSSSNLLKKAELFDIFESRNLGPGKRSMAFSLEYYDENRTLKDEEVDKDFNRAVEAVIKQLNAEFRGTS